ncbi:hypothetical protein M8818_003682 [Zalaria obscura]|uniref:Uncharacterized protein n=1 Tax=Zalaria obscura TaxID=2024903 RepID=A0ACC3SFZ0_9PEZI
MASPPQLWPNAARAAISITMDNMGEAADLHRGLWPTDQPVGDHFSVKKSLPKMLDLLAEKNITATYFIESWNCDVYPDAIKTVAEKGHEVGWHAFQHEVWSQLDADAEKDNFARSFANAEKVPVVYKGFRPPGGQINPQTLALMKERGLTYLSPAAERAAVVEDVAIVPFRWREIDAYFYLPSCSVLRTARGDPESPMPESLVQERLCAAVDEAVAKGGYASFLFHPFLTDSEERLAVMRTVVEYVREKEGRGEVWCAPCGEVAEWMLGRKGEFGGDPGWDNAQWKKK